MAMTRRAYRRPLRRLRRVRARVSSPAPRLAARSDRCAGRPASSPAARRGRRRGDRTGHGSSGSAPRRARRPIRCLRRSRRTRWRRRRSAHPGRAQDRRIGGRYRRLRTAAGDGVRQAPLARDAAHPRPLGRWRHVHACMSSQAPRLRHRLPRRPRRATSGGPGGPGGRTRSEQGWPKWSLVGPGRRVPRPSWCCSWQTGHRPAASRSPTPTSWTRCRAEQRPVGHVQQHERQDRRPVQADGKTQVHAPPASSRSPTPTRSCSPRTRSRSSRRPPSRVGSGTCCRSCFRSPCSSGSSSGCSAAPRARWATSCPSADRGRRPTPPNARAPRSPTSPATRA